jgi:RND family efflux transporter MFP subunit
MAKIKSFIKRKKYLLIGGAVLVILGLLAFGKSKLDVETFTVVRANVEQAVVLSGKVETTDKADLGFASSGRISKISVKNNQNVKSGQVLAQLEIGDLLADLRIKQANLRATDVDLKSAKDELEKITAQENAKVENAYRNLLTEDLVATPHSLSYSVDAPVISGIYDGSEGTYKIVIRREDTLSSDMEIKTFNLENSTRRVNKEAPTLFGTKGLYISFPDEPTEYDDTIWYVEIPNKSGDSYLSNYNAYVEAKNARDLAIKEAQAEYDKILTQEGNSDSSIALAEIQKINAEIRKNTIYAPFSGIVTNILKEVGENASVGEVVASVLGEERLEVVLQVSELDVSKLSPGTEVKISLDAFPGEEFVGTLKTINSRETKIDGVPVYEAFVELKADPRIKTGMSSNGKIVLEKSENVLVVPAYVIEKAEGSNFVKILGADGKIGKREVTIGLTGSDNMVEIQSGLSEGESVVVETN